MGVIFVHGGRKWSTIWDDPKVPDDSERYPKQNGVVWSLIFRPRNIPLLDGKTSQMAMRLMCSQKRKNISKCEKIYGLCYMSLPTWRLLIRRHIPSSVCINDERIWLWVIINRLTTTNALVTLDIVHPMNARCASGVLIILKLWVS